MATDVFAWFLNVSTSVLIVFVNKVLMDPKMGYKFVFGKWIRCIVGAMFGVQQGSQTNVGPTYSARAATTLCAFHFLACGASVRIMEAVGIGKRAVMPLKGGNARICAGAPS